MMVRYLLMPVGVFSLVWVWAWMVLGAGGQATTTKVRTDRVTECLPNSQYEPSHLITTYSAPSQITCAALCLKKKALQYTFNDGQCQLTGEGLGAASSSGLFTAHFLLPSEAASLVEVARNKPTNASPSSSIYPASEAVDGIEDPSMSNMYHSNYVTHPWWLVDLGQSYNIYEIKILSRIDCCSDRLHDIEIRVGHDLMTDSNFSGHKLFSLYPGPYSASYGYLSCFRTDGVAGRYVSIKRDMTGTDPLQLKEVKVFVQN